jgi:hypothetical protein
LTQPTDDPQVPPTTWYPAPPQYQAPPPLQPPYGYAPPLLAAPKPHEGLGIAALVLGIVAVCSLGWFIPGAILAVIFGAVAWRNGAKAKWGFWLGIVAVAAFVLWIVAIANSTDSTYRSLGSNPLPAVITAPTADQTFDATLQAVGVDTSGISDPHGLAHQVCIDVSGGTGSIDEAQTLADTYGWDYFTAGEFVGAAEGAYCPENVAR